MTLSQQAPSLVERLNDPIAHDRETTVQLICRWRTERREAAAMITELEGFAQGWHRAVETILTIAGLSPALGAVEAVEAMRERLAPAEPSGWRPIDQAPDLGRKIVALYDDGSGASMFWRHDGGYIDAYGDEWGELPDHYALWTYLPDSFQFWCEYRSDEPMTLTLPPTSEGCGA